MGTRIPAAHGSSPNMRSVDLLHHPQNTRSCGVSGSDPGSTGGCHSPGRGRIARCHHERTDTSVPTPRCQCSTVPSCTTTPSPQVSPHAALPLMPRCQWSSAARCRRLARCQWLRTALRACSSPCQFERTAACRRCRSAQLEHTAACRRSVSDHTDLTPAALCSRSRQVLAMAPLRWWQSWCAASTAVDAPSISCHLARTAPVT